MWGKHYLSKTLSNGLYQNAVHWYLAKGLYVSVRLLWKALPSREEPDISSSIINTKARLHPHYTRNISPKHGSALNTRSLYVRVTSRKRKTASGVAVRGDSGVAGERRVVDVPTFHSWGKCSMPFTNINSDWMSNSSSGLCIITLFTRVHLGV